MKGGIKRSSIFLFVLILFFAMIGISEADFEGTIGTRFTITDSGFGTKKPQVYIQYDKPGVVKKVYAKVETWSDTSITCLWTKPLSPGTYNLWAKPNIAKTNPIAEGTFTIMSPSIDEVIPDVLTPRETITITGQFFTNKKPAVYLQDLVSLKKRSCRVVSSTMDSATGVSSLNFIVPKWGSGNYEIILQTLVGEASINPLVSVSQTGLNNWHMRNSGTTSDLMAITYGNGTFVAGGGKYEGRGFGPMWNSSILTSPDGVTWTQRYSEGNFFIDGVTYGSGTFVAVTYGAGAGTSLTSSDGVIWTQRYLAPYYLLGVIYCNGTFVAVCGEGAFTDSSGAIQSGAILTSPDGVAWTERYSGGDFFINAVTCGNNLFVAVGNLVCTGGRSCVDVPVILTSSDGLSWTQNVSVMSQFNTLLYGVSYGNGTFVAVGDNGSILTSSDGITWISRNSGTNGTLRDVTYGNGTFVAVGDNGSMLTSPDGVTWTFRNSGIPDSLYGVTYGNSTFVVVGPNGAIIQSDPVK